MKELSREEFIKISTATLASAFLVSDLLTGEEKPEADIDQDFLSRLVAGNDRAVERALKMMSGSRQVQYYRYLSGPVANFSAAYCHPKSIYYRSKQILQVIEETIGKLLALQHGDGTMDAGGNRKSPPDTAFLLDSLTAAAAIMKNQEFEELAQARKDLDQFLLKAGEALRTGGVHTPNHRWVVCAMLAKLYMLYKDKKYLDRIEEWLAEGVYLDPDGQYPERSRNYSVVENNSLITIAALLNRPAYFEIVKKNLTATYYYMEADGELVTLDSRRQDQYKPISIIMLYFAYRYLAIREQDPFLAAVARYIETLANFEDTVLSRALPLLMERPDLGKKLPAAATLPESYNKYFPSSALARIKNGNLSASIYGGNDKPMTIASGRSCIPTFFTLRKAAAVLEYARISTSFFSMGYFRSDGVIKKGDTYRLSEQKKAYYYHPLPANKRKKDGDYPLSESLDHRFWSKMDFGSRPTTILTLDSVVTIEDLHNAFKIEMEFTGAEQVEVILDLCFRAGGRLDGAVPGDEKDDYFLKEGYAVYTIGNDSIKVGPGKAEHMNMRGLDGEEYTTHFGTIKGKGLHLYITGLVPFKHTITIS
jgi:hypothetical protein